MTHDPDSAHRRVVDEAAQLAGKVALQCLRRRLDAARSRDVDGNSRQALRVACLLAEPRGRVVSCAMGMLTQSKMQASRAQEVQQHAVIMAGISMHCRAS